MTISFSPFRLMASALVACASIATNALSIANTLRSQDFHQLWNVHGQLVQLEGDVNQIAGSMIRSKGLASDSICMMQIYDQVIVIDRFLSPVAFAVGISVNLVDAEDEKMSVTLLATPLKDLFESLKSAHGRINNIYGEWHRSQPAYDKAKVLMGFIDELGPIVASMLKRVEAVKAF